MVLTVRPVENSVVIWTCPPTDSHLDTLPQTHWQHWLNVDPKQTYSIFYLYCVVAQLLRVHTEEQPLSTLTDPWSPVSPESSTSAGLSDVGTNTGRILDRIKIFQLFFFNYYFLISPFISLYFNSNAGAKWHFVLAWFTKECCNYDTSETMAGEGKGKGKKKKQKRNTLGILERLKLSALKTALK